MITLQKYLEQKHPTKEDKESVREIDINKINDGRSFLLDGSMLDLRKFVNIEVIDVCNIHGKKFDSSLIGLNLSGLVNLTELSCSTHGLTSVDFLNQLPNPEKLRTLVIYNNRIKSTDISFFSRFINLKELRVGNSGGHGYSEGSYNRFYGSFKSLKNLTKLQSICIDATDVDEGLEYLTFIFTTPPKPKFSIDCSPYGTNAKCKAIQDQLRPFNYDLEAWQLANPDKMLIARPECFTNPDSKNKWIQALNKKLSESHRLLVETREYEARKGFESFKLSKIARLEAKISELELAKSTISQQTQTEFSTQEKATQTDLSHQDITKLEQQNQQLKKLLQATEAELTNTKQQLKELQGQLTTSQTTHQEQVKQLESKLKLLEQQKSTYQTKYDKSIEFIKEIREDIAKNA